MLVEAAGIEPASASSPLYALHAYSVINLTNGNPTDGGRPLASLVKVLTLGPQTYPPAIL